MAGVVGVVGGAGSGLLTMLGDGLGLREGELVLLEGLGIIVAVGGVATGDATGAAVARGGVGESGIED